MIRHFYACAVPRSGTTYFGQLLNSHGKAVCSHELMAPSLVTLDWLSEAGLSQAAPYAPASAVESVRQSLQSKPGYEVFGDKTPRGFFYLPRLLKVFQAGTVFLLLREPAGFFASFNARAANPQDDWPSWMNWLHAYLEWMVTLETAASVEADNLVLVSYAYLTQADTRQQACQRVFDCLKLDVDLSVEQFLQSSLQETKRSAAHARVRSEFEAALLSLPHMVAASQQLSCLGLSHSSSSRKQLLSECLVSAAADMDSVFSLVHAYLCNEGAQHLELLNSVFKLAGGRLPPMTRALVGRLVQSVELAPHFR